MADTDTESSATTKTSTLNIDPIHHLPLSLLRSCTIPPAPTRSDPPGSTIDWLPNFSDLSWIAYGASSLLVISHFPSPLSPNETTIGPVFRQVFELSGDPSSSLNAVSWSPATPSVGELAAAAENCVWVFAHDSATSQGSFCWSQSAILVQSAKVDAVRWTRSGDGIIAGGAEVVLWKRSNRFWEIAWKCKTDRPQILVSTTWSIEGPSATAAYANTWKTDGSPCVSVCQNDGKLGYGKVELNHPLPVSMIQWRPIGRESNGNSKNSERNVLLTCCLDGTVRLWCEIDNGKGRKIGKEIKDHKMMRRSFCVAAVIEINQSIRGTLGMDVSVTWAIEIEGIFEAGEGGKKFFSSKRQDYEKAGKCEWLIGFGPGMLVSLWAVHCLDDVSPMRFPRVTLWKTLELHGLEDGVSRTNLSNFEEKNIFLNKAAVLRDNVYGPPKMCSLIQLLPSNSLAWSLLCTQTSGIVEESSLEQKKIENVSCLPGGLLDLDSHTGKILQVAVHPYSCEFEFAVSLDSNGLLLFWSMSTISNCILGRATLVPTWELHGKLGTRDSCSKYTSLRWAPVTSGQELVLLLGHVGGIDCFVVKTNQREDESVECHYLCTIPFTGHGTFEEGPTDIFSIPLPSTRNDILKSHKFMLLGVWMNGFRALSWEVELHSYDLSGSCCGCNFEPTDSDECYMWSFGTTFCGKRYCVNVCPCSSQLPEPHKHDHVTSFAVVSPDYLASQISASFSGQTFRQPAYIMATGCANGCFKLWRSKLDEKLTSGTLWELVGLFMAHQGPISAICLSDCGRKVATICHSNDIGTVCVWESAHIVGSGAFFLEDTMALDGKVVALNWLALGNGHLLLGVCLQNQLRIYSQRCFTGEAFLNYGKSLKGEIWRCIAFAHIVSPIKDFLWGPRASAVVVHDSYLSIISQWVFFMDEKHQAKVQNHKSSCLYSAGEKEEGINSAIFSDCDIGKFTELLLEDDSKEQTFGTPEHTNMKKGCHFSSLLAARAQLERSNGMILGLWNMLEVIEKLGGSLQPYHPDTLLINIFRGNWKRAYSAVRHLVESLTCASEKRCNTVHLSYVVPQIPLSNYFEGLLEKSLPAKGFHWGGNASLTTLSSQFHMGVSQFAYNLDSNSSNNLFMSSSTRSELSALIEPLEKFYELAAITNVEKTQILAVIDLLGEMTNPNSAYGSLDEPGQRFWVTLKFQQLHFFRRCGRAATMEELVIDSSLIVWAYHSDCEENLFGSVLPNEPSWPEMRNLGVGFWFTNAAQLRAKMEKLARSQYLKNKNPKDCALLYVALNRIQVLVGLFKISKDEKDKPLVGFLSRNFKEEKNKLAALKNAYVLMGRHQHELAIAFFLLGGDIASAVNVCAKNLGDEQLALVICRLVEGSGGLSEHHLITKILLPSAIEKGDNWLASLLEWELGNYYQSFMRMFSFQTDSTIEKSAVFSNNVCFLEPKIGLYCLTLATKNSTRNAVGDQNTAILGRWAILMTTIALSRRGLPLEALECLSSSMNVLGNTNQGNASSFEHSNTLHGFLKPSGGESSNWLSNDVPFCLEYHAKIDLALKYFSKLLREHPSWEAIIVRPVRAHTCSEYEHHQIVQTLESFQQKFDTELLQFEQKFSLLPLCLVSKILGLLHNHSLLFVGYDIFRGYINQDHLQDEILTVDRISLYSLTNKPLLKVAEETSLLSSRFIAACSMDCSQLKSYFSETDVYCESISSRSNAWGYDFQCALLSLRVLRASLKITHRSLGEDLIMKPLRILDLVEYFVYFAYSWLQRNSRALFQIVEPLLLTHTNVHTLYDVDIVNLKKLLPDLVALKSLLPCDVGGPQNSNQLSENQGSDIRHSIPEDERWHIMGACLWQHMSRFIKHKLNDMAYKLDDNCFSGLSHGKPSASSNAINLESDEKSLKEQIGLVSLILVKLLNTTAEHFSSYHVNQLASYLHKKMENGWHAMTLIWLEESSQCQSSVLCQNPSWDIVHLDVSNDRYGFNRLWDICADPKIISESFAREKISFLHCFDHKPSKGWKDTYEGMGALDEAKEVHNQNSSPSTSSATTETGTPKRHQFRNGNTFLSSWQKDNTITKETACFLSPREVLKRNGELLEALCINSIHEGQAAVASNRKGILFFNWEDEMPFRDHCDSIWSVADWPLNGWAGSVSIPAPTCVSPGIGLGSKKGAHLGLGGATVGVSSFAMPRRDLTGGGAFGVPGYAGIGASGLGWGTREDFEEVVDSPPTMENISTRAFSSHPSRPIFLVGSSNTHIYLWEFGKNKATATYGVLPAANVPPPYALASISALQFDHYGHRFASAALDGTVSTWQLEVGGRSNIRPTETSHCFDSHALDVTYITSSGSIIAVAGYSSSGVNVVIWDTLAPPTTSQASIVCHEGGGRSLSVFDNDIGSGSISPLIITGGKDGDVGIHDFRYIATGKTKRHKHSNVGQTTNTSSNIDTQTANGNTVGDQNINGMVWYIPKAHSGSVTKISTIPNTSLFLTGSKDGDVKLWDAKKAKMVFHWPKLHERHTFLQPRSRGYGGVVRVAVTDVQVTSHGFLTCGGDGTVKLTELKDQHRK